ncbi:MAG TPA: WYL domain-containing protein [Solirubrobacteraceae bacterium]|nr:WYL domain-containing protein [Solirubrobacteraceae bacterium]
MAKDTEKLIRQLSLISYLMAERRPVTALEIRRDVEGYSGMNEDAFARRFYADRAELVSLGIALTVDKPPDGVAEQENYSLRAENFHLPAIEFDDAELAGLQTALGLLDGEFAYAEPLRLALQQITWGRPSPLASAEQHAIALGITGSSGGHEQSQRHLKIEQAIFREKTITFDYQTIERDELSPRRVDPYVLLYRGSQYYLLGYSHERGDIRVFRLSRIRGRVAFATKAEHDFRRPSDFDPRAYADQAEWQFGEEQGRAQILVSERIAWQVERNFAKYGRLETTADGERRFITAYAHGRTLISWLLALGEHARLLGPPELVAELQRRLELLESRHTQPPEIAPPAPPPPRTTERSRARRSSEDRGDVAIRPERFARLVTLASILIKAGREGRRLPVAVLLGDLQISEGELREDLSVLNVVNFGGGSYVLYAEIDEGTSEIEVDPEPYSDNFARPARLLPIEAKSLVAAIDLLGEHLPQGSLASARAKIVAALGEDPSVGGLHVAEAAGDDSEIARLVSDAINRRRVLELEYYKENEDEFTRRRIEPYALINGQEGWYIASFDLARNDVRHFRLDRVKRASVTEDVYEPREEVNPAADIDGWPRTGEVSASRNARVWIAPERARWAREQRRVTEELADGAVIVQLGFGTIQWLVREVLKEAGDAVVLEPQDAREAVLAAAQRLRREPAAV